MFTHIRLVSWALRTLWGLKVISKKNRRLLWHKSLRLYAAILAFTDKERPKEQLKNAMACAILTAVYDYDTDWVRTQDPETSLSFQLLDSLLANHPSGLHAISIAKKLFRLDWSGHLSEDGLERGSMSLQFYNLVIQSNWMSSYSERQISLFGRKLQIVDDLLDLEKDRSLAQTNCFLTAKATRFKREIEGFLASQFFLNLENNSEVYKELRRKIQGEKEKHRFPSNLFETSRPLSGLYAGLLAIVGCRFYQPISYVAALIAFCFAFITWSIMSVNDWSDRLHDVKKGKDFASKNWLPLLRYCLLLCGLTIIAIVAVAYLSLYAGLFCLGAWLLGLCYSLTPIQRTYRLNNAVVAFCSASPVLAGSFYNHNLVTRPLLIFLALFFIILNREVYLDMKDRHVDEGYKNTLPVKGPGFAALHLIGTLHFWPVCLIFYPNPWVKAIAFLAAPIQAQHGLMLFRPEKYKTAKRILDWVIRLLLIALLITE